MELREGVFFCFGENNGKYHSFFRTFIICHSPQKSSAAQKVYKPDRKAFAGLNLSVSADAVPPPLPRGGFGIPQSFPSQFKVFLSARGSPTRGASGETVHFAGTAKASPTRRGGIASAMTERLYEGEPDLFHAKRPLHFCSGLFSENQAG